MIFFRYPHYFYSLNIHLRNADLRISLSVNVKQKMFDIC